MRLLVLALLFCSLAGGQQQCNSGQTNAQSTAGKQASFTPPAAIQAIPAPASQAKAGEQEGKATTEAPSRPFLTHGEWVMAILTLIYVVLTGAYVCVSIRILRTIGEQAAHMKEQVAEMRAAGLQTEKLIGETEKSAVAALLNAKAVISAERPWILVKTEATGEVPRRAQITFRGKNWGRTPARVTRMSVEMIFRTRNEDYPPEPPYQQTELAYPQYLAPKEPFMVDSFSLGSVMTDGIWEEVNKDKQRVVFLGHVVYFDLIADTAIGAEHETRFCYFLSPNPGVGLVMTGPRNYNQHT